MEKETISVELSSEWASLFRRCCAITGADQEEALRSFVFSWVLALIQRAEQSGRFEREDWEAVHRILDGGPTKMLAAYERALQVWDKRLYGGIVASLSATLRDCEPAPTITRTLDYLIGDGDGRKLQPGDWKAPYIPERDCGIPF
jgi:hypothetical protein